MSISCSCEYDVGIRTVGDPREVTCRTPRLCHACSIQIVPNDRMYMWSMYDWDIMRACSPLFICEECGDMSLNLIEYGYCFDFSEGLRKQWLDYKEEEELYADKRARISSTNGKNQ